MILHRMYVSWFVIAPRFLAFIERSIKLTTTRERERERERERAVPHL